MARHVHVHLHDVPTRDSWEESKHPRKDDGKFGSGSGPSKGDGKALMSPAEKKKLRAGGGTTESGKVAMAAREGGPIKAGERITIKPHWQDRGDDKFDWEVVGAEEKGRLDVVAIDRKTGKRGGTQLVYSDQVDRASKK